MRTILERHLSKGPKAHYAVGMRELPTGMFEVVFRWENPKSNDRRSFLFREEAHAAERCQEKIRELTARGYELRAGTPAADASPEPCPCVTPAPAALQHVTTASTRTEALSEVLQRRRREASWALE